jgi:hypothetical protein
LFIIKCALVDSESMFRRTQLKENEDTLTDLPESRNSTAVTEEHQMRKACWIGKKQTQKRGGENPKRDGEWPALVPMVGTWYADLELELHDRARAARSLVSVFSSTTEYQ